MKATKRPWLAAGCHVVNEYGTRIAAMIHCQGDGSGIPEGQANAVHIVKCVNALEGYDPAAVAALLLEIKDWFDDDTQEISGADLVERIGIWQAAVLRRME